MSEFPESAWNAEIPSRGSLPPHSPPPYMALQQVLALVDIVVQDGRVARSVEEHLESRIRQVDEARVDGAMAKGPVQGLAWAWGMRNAGRE